MNIVQLYQDYNIPYQSEGHKHCRPGWINVPCPFCSGNTGLHLGYNLDDNYYYCWRCGGHSIRDTLIQLLGVQKSEASRLLKLYSGHRHSQIRKEAPVIIRRKAFQLPSGIIPLTQTHRKYLSLRGFDPDQLVADWGIQSTGPISFLDEFNYNYRIFIPIYWAGQLVNFQARLARDPTKDEAKYKACPEGREVINIKHIIYGKQDLWEETGICVEGVTDVWRLGPAAFATFGIKVKPQQIRLIAKTFKRVAVVYDDDPQAQVEAKKMVAELKFRGLDAWNVVIKGDPGGLNSTEAKELVFTILKNK